MSGLKSLSASTAHRPVRQTYYKPIEHKLQLRKFGAGNEIRTRDILVGNEMLYH